MGGKVGGDNELLLPSSLCQLGSCPTDAPRRALVSTFPLKQVMGEPAPRPLAFAGRVRDGRFPTMAREGGDLVWAEVISGRTSPGGSGVPCTPAFTRKPGWGGRKGVKFPQLKCNHRYGLALHASPLLAPSPCTHWWGFSAE